MASTSSREIECLKRLDELTASHHSILEYLRAEELISKEEVKAIVSSAETAKMIWAKLEALSGANKLQLLEYEWVLLPVERVKLTVITDRNNKEFPYGY